MLMPRHGTSVLSVCGPYLRLYHELPTWNSAIVDVNVVNSLDKLRYDGANLMRISYSIGKTSHIP